MNEKIKKKINGTVKKVRPLSAVLDFFKRPKVISSSVILLFMALVLSSLFLSPRIFESKMHEGDIALRDVYAPYDFTYKWGVNKEATEARRRDAIEAVPYYLRRDGDVKEEVEQRLKLFFEELETARELGEEEGFAYMKELYPDMFSRDEHIMRFLDYADTENLKSVLLDLSSEVYSEGLIAEETLELLREKETGNIMFADAHEEGKVVLEDLMVLEEVEEETSRIARGALSGRFALQRGFVELFTGILEEDLYFDEDYTQQRRLSVSEEVKSVPKIWTVKKNELIVSKGKRVDSQDMAELMAISSIFRPGSTKGIFMGVVLFLIILGLVWFLYANLTESRVFLGDSKDLSIVLANMFVMLLLSNWIIHLPQPSNFIPLAGMGMILSLILGFHAAFIAVSLTGVLIALLFGAGIETFFVLLAGSLVGIYVIGDARRRVQIIWAGIAVGVTKFSATIAIGLINDMDLSFFINDGLWSFASGILSAFFVLALLPVFEHLFKVTTNITLVELSDLNHPLLKRLATVAPGTYHHSILVGNLAEAGCDAIGANSLRARVGSYYHDIGKIEKPEYFSENEMLSGPKHDKLAPSMSALIILQHVKKGLELARKHKMNSVIMDFIGQHHGNSLISFFYQKALNGSGEETKTLKDQDFRYPGPRPQTKETAIVLLADSVEAATKALKNPTPAQIRGQVQKIINAKFIDGQLDECDLTLRDIHAIQESFVRVLTGMYHQRLQYPEDSLKKNNKNGFPDDSNKFTKREPKDRT